MKRFILVCVLMLLSSCAHKTAVHGYLAESPIKVGERKEIVRIMSGDPTLINGETWYYVRIGIRSDPVGIRKSYTSTVVQVIFSNDVVKDVRKITVPKEKAARITRDKDLQDGGKKLARKLENMFSESTS